MCTMKAAVVHEFKQPLRVEDVPKPEPGPDEAVFRVEQQASHDPDDASTEHQ